MNGPRYWFQPPFYDRSPSFWAGVREGIKAYAVWRNGEQEVGIMQTPLKDVLTEVDAAEKWSTHGRDDL